MGTPLQGVRAVEATMFIAPDLTEIDGDDVRRFSVEDVFLQQRVKRALHT